MNNDTKNNLAKEESNMDINNKILLVLSKHQEILEEHNRILNSVIITLSGLKEK